MLALLGALAVAAALQGPGTRRQMPNAKRHQTPRALRPAAAAAAAGGAPAASAGASPAATAAELCSLAEAFITSQSGFYSPSVADRFASDFVFRGPVVGPLNKMDYLNTMETFRIHVAFPDISPNAWGFSVDPADPLRVWFFVRNSGTNTGPFGLDFGAAVPPSGRSLQGAPEAFSITFDSARRVKLLTVGYVADRFQGNTNGFGAAFGLLQIVGISVPPTPIYRAVIAVTNRLPGGSKTCSAVQDVPKWWRNVSKARGPDAHPPPSRRAKQLKWAVILAIAVAAKSLARGRSLLI
ncbi:hypothetical protein M885DRAFT_542891 [Pelagophyceae sp. CCMP2097]|nr:hypothetical protein M885DRAFT_542891 [Pelagophyceae sp. CCMP2097]